MDEPNQYQKIKQHVKDNKKVYFAAGGGVAVGAVGVFFATGGHVTIVDGVKFIHLQYKSPNINIVLDRRACREPIPVRDKLTGEVYASLTRAAEITGKNLKDISKDVKGLQDRFERLPDYVLV
ncbi:MAG: hypothetical protein ACJ8BW_08310 [Ktedonobacteraceae bacterium]